MHELGMCEAIVEATLRRAGGRRVRAVRVRVGGHPVDAGVVDQGFQMMAAGTCAEGASIEVVAVPLHAHCGSCGHVAEVAHPLDLMACSACGGVDVTVDGTDEVVLESIAVDAPEEGRAAWTPSSC